MMARLKGRDEGLQPEPVHRSGLVTSRTPVLR